MSCSKDPSRTPCDSRCEKKISCGHQCKKRCTDECNTEEQCDELIKIKCRNNHELQVACRSKHDPPCKIPCKETLKCEHECPGNCGDCSQGRLHVPCNKKCDRNLVCGHICPGFCHTNCPPCKKKCARSCAHRDKCNRKCGEACIQCRDQCDWRCREFCPNNFCCDGLCHEICRRQKCNTPCYKLLKCGHKCRGLLCENKCLKVCGECDHKKLTKIFFGTEDEKDAIFIELDDCKCFYEVTGLDKFIELQFENFKENGINCIRCFKCSTIMTSSSRYRNELKMINGDIENVYRIIRESGNIDVNGTKMREMLALINNFDHEKDRKQLSKMYEQTVRLRTVSQLQLTTDQISFLNQVNCLQNNAVNLSEKQVVLANLSRIRRWTAVKRTRYSSQEHEEFLLEVRRLQLQIDVLKFWKELQTNHKEYEVLPRNIADILEKVQSGSKIVDTKISSLRKEFEETSSELIGLTFEEKQMIKRTMEIELRGSGHWYKCDNGHMYCIGECGMPTVERKCPHCDLTIGGTNHMLTDQNDRDMEMDRI